jgi:hypothetical protein
MRSCNAAALGSAAWLEAKRKEDSEVSGLISPKLPAATQHWVCSGRRPPQLGSRATASVKDHRPYRLGPGSVEDLAQVGIGTLLDVSTDRCW